MEKDILGLAIVVGSCIVGAACCITLAVRAYLEIKDLLRKEGADAEVKG